MLHAITWMGEKHFAKWNTPWGGEKGNDFNGHATVVLAIGKRYGDPLTKVEIWLTVECMQDY